MQDFYDPSNDLFIPMETKLIRMVNQNNGLCV